MAETSSVESSEGKTPLVVALARFAARYRLSQRELQVLHCAGKGWSMKESAAELKISAKTVEDYWSRICAKTKRRSRLAVLARLLEWMAGELAAGAGGAEPARSARNASRPTILRESLPPP